MSISPISVLMACYNAEQFLEETILCILSQTFEDFELLVVDDGSTDGTLKLLNKYARNDKRLRVLTKEHTGLTDSLQYGLKAAQGEWVARWDADDLADPRRLEIQFRYIQKYPNVVLLGSGCVEIDILGKPIKMHIYPTDHQLLIRNLIRLQKFFPHSSALFNRIRALSVGGYRTRFTYAQDHDLWLRLAMICKIACLAEPLIYLRRHNEAISHKHLSSQFLLNVAAAVCHFRRIRKLSDPSGMEETVWREFLEWVERRLIQEGVLTGKIISTKCHMLYHCSRNLQDCVKSLMMLLRRPMLLARTLISQLIGSDIASRLANEWSGSS